MGHEDIGGEGGGVEEREVDFFKGGDVDVIGGGWGGLR